MSEIQKQQPELIARVEAGPPRRARTSNRANDLDGVRWLRNSISIWSDIRKTAEEYSLKHPAMFPAGLATRLIESFTRSDQTQILDPFVGVGSTVIAAEALGKTGIGFDISADFLAKAMARPRSLMHNAENGARSGSGERFFVHGDAKNLLLDVEPESIDFVLTSPPYWDILLQRRSADYKDIRNYGDSSLDLGRIAEYGEFLEALAEVFRGVLVALKPGSYCCVVVMDLRKGANFYPFHSDLAKRMEEIGYIYDDLIIWDRSHEYNNLRPLGHPSVFRINKVHEYILIFKRPNASGR